MSMPYIELLKKTQILQGLSAEQLEIMTAVNPVVTYNRDQVVFEEYSDGREIYIVLQGEVDAQVDPASEGAIERGSTELRVIRTFRPGESFGEVAVIDKHPRTATMVATQDDTQLLIIPSTVFDNVLQAQTIMNNIARDLSDKVRGSNRQLIETMLAGYFLTVMVENLENDAYKCDPITPLQQSVVIRSADNFILSGQTRLVTTVPEKEAIEVSFFAAPQVLQSLIGAGEPSGAVILNALFSIIRSGHISGRIVDSDRQFQFQFSPDRRSGRLVVQKNRQVYTLEWQIKGARYQPQTRTTSAYLFLYIYADESTSTRAQAEQIVANIAMPVQKYVYQSFPRKDVGQKTRVVIIHHRSHETARTLQTVRELGYQIDSFIGIPYGDVNWDYITMLDHASDHKYMSLRLVQHPTQPTQYQFDFRQSSFLDWQAEQDLSVLYENPTVTGNYMTAMQALAEYRLVQALHTCRERGERLIVYEDGGYIVAKIYEIYKNDQHPSHAIIKAAIDDGIIVGVVEVTVAGERKNQQMIEENGGKAMLPVLSNARSDIKAVFEAMGVAEAVIHASATALGRLGLPTFQARRIAVIGANGAIGTRLMEQLTTLHNSTANLFAIARSERPFSMLIDQESLPFAATRLKYRGLPRFLVSERCLPIILDTPYRERAFLPDALATMQLLQGFLQQNPKGYSEAVLTNSYPLSEQDSVRLWHELEQQTGYQCVESTSLPNEAGRRYKLQNGDNERLITLLGESTVLTFENVSRAIRSGVDTILGSTGLPVFNAKNLDDFFRRKSTAQVDELVLISASSKDYEFRSAIDFLNSLLSIQSNAVVPADTQLRWFADFYKDELSFLQGEDFHAIQSLLASPLSEDTLRMFIQTAPRIAAAMQINGQGIQDAEHAVVDYIAQKIRQRLTIRKEIRPDIGSIYHLTVNGQHKRVVLLADGLVINFFAKHEKGVKTEYIDPIVTMQVLSLVKLSTDQIDPGLYKMDVQLRPEDLNIFWAAINDYCRPLSFESDT